jgi:Fe-S oxidoreductase
LSARAAKRGLTLHDRLVGYLPHYAPYAARVPWLMNLRDALPGMARLSESIAGFAARRPLPKWRQDVFHDSDSSWPGLSRPSTSSLQQNVDARHKAGHDGGVNREVLVFADTFNRYFERENIDAAIDVLNVAGYSVRVATPPGGGRALCCGRTFLSIGKVDEAKREAARTLAALTPYVERGVPVIGLEPSCLLGFRDEIPALIKSEAARRIAGNALLFEEFLAREAEAGRFAPLFGKIEKRALLHGHCHQKSFGAMSAVEKVLKLIPGLAVESVESSCCGMAGGFGYGADTVDVSLAMGELSLLPAVRKADAGAIIVADGTSCRQQIRDGAGREALHVARVLEMSLRGPHGH